MTESIFATVLETITKPNTSFREISYNENRYFGTSVVIFFLASFFFLAYSSENTNLPTNELGYVLDATAQITSIGVSLLLNFISIMLVYFISKKVGGNANFKKVFNVLAFALIPVAIGGVIVHVFLYSPSFLSTISGISLDDPEFVGLFFPIYFVFIAFVFWTLFLTIKAIKIVNAFGTAKAFGIFILSAIVMYVSGLFIPGFS